MSKAFTLVELMIAISLMLVFTVSGAIYINNFINKQKLDKVVSEVETMVNLAQNYAKVRQVPSGFVGQVSYVKLTINGSGKIEATVNGTATTYFSNKISESDVTVTINPAILYFWGGSGKLSNNTDLVNTSFYASNQTATITVSINKGVVETKTIVINPLGGIN